MQTILHWLLPFVILFVVLKRSDTMLQWEENDVRVTIPFQGPIADPKTTIASKLQMADLVEM